MSCDNSPELRLALFIIGLWELTGCIFSSSGNGGTGDGKGDADRGESCGDDDNGGVRGLTLHI